MSAQLASLRKYHSPFVRLSAEQTKVVTMGAPLNKYGLVTFLCLLMVWSEYNGFNVFFKLVVNDGCIKVVCGKDDSSENLVRL